MRQLKQPLFYLAFIVLTATACAQNVKLYAGPELADSRTALIRNDSRITEVSNSDVLIKEIDGMQVGSSIASVKVLPGPHLMKVECGLRLYKYFPAEGTYIQTRMLSERGQAIKLETVIVNVNTEAGRAYHPVASLRDDESCEVKLLDITPF